MYSEKVRQLVAELPYRGEAQQFTHSARRENPICGDVLEVTLRVVEDRVQELRFKAQGCTAALACGAALGFLCEGCSVQHCLSLDRGDLIDFLGGLPAHKLHGAELALETLRSALEQVRSIPQTEPT